MAEIKTHFSNKQLAKLIYPLVISVLLSNAVGIIDTVMISGLGNSSVSGVSLVDQINVLMLNIFAALATGGAVVTSQLIGARNEQAAEKSAKQLIYSAFAVSMVFALILSVFSKQLVGICFPKLDAETKSAASTYLFITAISYPFVAIENSCGALLRSFEKSNYCMYSSLICNIVNICGNAFFIYTVKLGVAGAAIATTVGRGVGMILMLIWISSKNSPIRINIFKNITIDTSLIKRILKIGIPSGFENGFFQLGRLLVVSIISNFGLVHTTANAVANNLDSFGCIFGGAMNLAAITVIGQCVGALDFDGVKHYAKKLLIIQYSIGTLFYAVTLIFINVILGWYNLDADTAQLTTLLVFIHNGIGMFIWPLSFIVPNFLRAANDIRFTLVIACISMAVCRLGLSYILGLFLGLGALGVWIGMIADWIFRTSFFVTRFVRGTWKKFCT